MVDEFSPGGCSDQIFMLIRLAWLHYVMTSLGSLGSRNPDLAAAASVVRLDNAEFAHHDNGRTSTSSSTCRACRESSKTHGSIPIS